LKRSTYTHHIKDTAQYKQQLLHWAHDQQALLWLDSNSHSDAHSNFDALLAVGEASSLLCTENTRAFDLLSTYRNKTQDWIFGHFSYDLKNDLEALHSANKDFMQFPELYFFQPKKIFILRGTILTQLYLPEVEDEAAIDHEVIENQVFLPKNGMNSLKIEPRFNKTEYIKRVQEMLSHIHRGDIYEANFCQEFLAYGSIDALRTYQHLNEISQAPFAAYFKQGKRHVLCTSPERYLQKKGVKIISQPIKGTSRRSVNASEDLELAMALCKDQKERSENIMITDLVRNDLSRVAQKGSVQVEELCGLHSFKQVHQLISTISANVSTEIPIMELIKKTFPMGSMTGAPKVSAMQIIENLESHKRGVYSGALGYFTPEGDFDFNVVIRSILYDAAREKISFSVGSAITALSDPEKEYEECLIKAKAMREVLGKC